MKGRRGIILPIVFLFIVFMISVFAFQWGMKAYSPLEIKKASLPGERSDPLRDALAKVANGLGNIELVGKGDYEAYCMVCHGEKGKGDGFNAFNLDPRPADLTIVQKRGDEHLFEAISKGSASVGGSPLCPPWGATVGEDRIKFIIAYIGTFGK